MDTVIDTFAVMDTFTFTRGCIHLPLCTTSFDIIGVVGSIQVITLNM